MWNLILAVLILLVVVGVVVAMALWYGTVAESYQGEPEDHEDGCD